MSTLGSDITDEAVKEVLHARRYFAQALDPIHVGTGGETLGRVDLAIVREPGTNLPKLPGTSLSGACRAYAALRDGRPQCAGQGQAKKNDKGETVREEHCGTCRICQTFGYAKGDSGGKKGAVQFTDAHIVAFPVASTGGPIWVTSADALAHVVNEKEAIADAAMGTVQSADTALGETVAIGWLALKRAPLTKTLPPLSGIAAERLVLVPNRIFPTIVNDNLEVRTSVSIDAITGAADDGALFTYEALPTGTVVVFTVTYQGKDAPTTRSEARTTVEDGLTLFAWLGVGGMNTRGMGRLRVLEGTASK